MSTQDNNSTAGSTIVRFTSDAYSNDSIIDCLKHHRQQNSRAELELHFLEVEWTQSVFEATILTLSELHPNTTLKAFCIHERPEGSVGTFANLNDASLALVLSSLTSHQSLEVLEVYSSWLHGAGATIHEIHRLLGSESCGIKKLTLAGLGYSPPIPNIVELFLEGLPQNRSLEYLSFERNKEINDNMANILLNHLWMLPNVQSINLRGCKVHNFIPLVANLHETIAAKHGLRRLDISDNDGGWGNQGFFSLVHWTMLGSRIRVIDFDEKVAAIMKLLEVFPLLGDLGESVRRAIDCDIIPLEVSWKLDCNRYFGMLQQDANIPLSVWPLVMARVNMDQLSEERQYYWTSQKPSLSPSILYAMLHGPALAER